MSVAFVENPHRLPTNVKPCGYYITLKTDLQDLTFQGFIKIDLDINAETTDVVLNTAHLDLGKALIYSYDLKTKQKPLSVTFDKNQERVSYKFINALPKRSKAQLRIRFTGKLTGNRIGYYRSSIEKDGETYYSVTQFAPTYARRAFPCWDEPQLKATFAVTMISREGTVNLSNMPATSEESLDPNENISSDIVPFISTIQNERWKITKFDITPPMSTYIVAYANGDFKYLEKSVVMPLSGKTIPLRIYGTPDIIHQGQFALDVKAAVLPLYEKVFEVEYPLPKLDTLVVSDFDPGAMENWGLITGRYNALLLDPSREDQVAKMRVAGTQSHEVAHMWFGNITTMEWWTYVYLNEGFATLMGEVIILDKLRHFKSNIEPALISPSSRAFPSWKADSQFITRYFSSAQTLDAKLSSHPVEVDCPDPKYINDVFDALAYYKAASVLRMLSSYIGEEKFLAGVSLYLKNKLYTNSVTQDLWEAIATATGIDIAAVMKNWITKTGYPVLSVTETANGIHVRQDLFLESGPAAPADNETIWQIPLRILSARDSKVSIDSTALLKERETTISLDTAKSFKLNAGTTGFFRVLYTPERFTRLAVEAAEANSIFSLEDRIGLVQDVFALAQAGYTKLSNALTLVWKWKNEPEQLVWRVIRNSLVELHSTWWENPKIVEQFDALRRNLFVPIVKKLGYEYSDDDSMDTFFLRTLAIEQASAGGDTDVIKELQRRFSLFIESADDSGIPADLQPAVFIAAVKYGGREEYNAMVKIHDVPKTPSQKSAAILGMAAAQDQELLEETTRVITTKARDQDIADFFAALGTNSKARRLLTKYFTDNYDTLYDRFESAYQFSKLVKFSTNFYSSEEDCTTIEACFKDKDTFKYRKELAQSLDGIRARSEYVKRSTLDLAEWLRQSTAVNQ